MIAMIGLESIGDDADHRARVRVERGFSRDHLPLDRFQGRRSDFGRAMRDSIRYEDRPRAWVARITGRSARFGLERDFLPFKRDYAEANSTGSRGVYKWYEVPEGWVVEVNAPTSWEKADRYFARSQRGKLVRMTREELDHWLDALDVALDAGAGI